MNRKQSITLQPSGDYPTFSDSSYASTLTFSCGPRRPITFKHAGGDDFSSEFHPELKLNYLLPKRPLHSLHFSNDRYNEKEDSNSKVVNYLVNVYYLVNVNYLDPKRTTKAT